MKKIIESIANFNYQLRWLIEDHQFLDTFFDNEDVQHFFQHKALNLEEKKVFVKKNKKGILALINYEKNPNQKNWHQLIPCCFRSSTSETQKVLSFSDVEPTAIFYYALKFNIIKATHYDVATESNYIKKNDVFTLTNYKLVRYIALSMLINGTLLKVPYLIDNHKCNLQLFQSDEILNQMMVQALRLNQDEKEIFFEKILLNLEKKGINLEKISTFNTYSDVYKHYKEYQHFVIKKEVSHLHSTLTENNSNEPKRKQKI